MITELTEEETRIAHILFDCCAASSLAEAEECMREIVIARMADAWDEGYGDDAECGMPRKNPYRATEEPS